MRVVSFTPLRSRQDTYFGVVENGEIIGFEGAGSAMDLIGQYSQLVEPDARRWSLDDVHLGAPIRPGKIIAVGLNYRDHAEEQGVPIPETPLLFAKFTSSVSGPYDPIEKLAETTQLDYEGELGVVIGSEVRNASVDEAALAVAGYLVVNDVSARDAQFADGQWVRGKSFDTFAPMGPWLVTRDEIPDPNDLDIKTWVNGELRQSSSTRNLIFGVSDLIAYCSRYFTLNPGDLICTGTPGGVGVFQRPPIYLDDGDEVVVEIERIGAIKNRVTSRGKGAIGANTPEQVRIFRSIEEK